MGKPLADKKISTFRRASLLAYLSYERFSHYNDPRYVLHPNRLEPGLDTIDKIQKILSFYFYKTNLLPFFSSITKNVVVSQRKKSKRRQPTLEKIEIW